MLNLLEVTCVVLSGPLKTTKWLSEHSQGLESPERPLRQSKPPMTLSKDLPTFFSDTWNLLKNKTNPLLAPLEPPHCCPNPCHPSNWIPLSIAWSAFCGPPKTYESNHRSWQPLVTERNLANLTALGNWGEATETAAVAAWGSQCCVVLRDWTLFPFVLHSPQQPNLNSSKVTPPCCFKSFKSSTKVEQGIERNVHLVNIWAEKYRTRSPRLSLDSHAMHLSDCV